MASYPEPDDTRCPLCRAALGTAVCTTCGADLSSAAGVELWSVDTELHRLGRRRTVLVEQIAAARSSAGHRPPPPDGASGPVGLPPFPVPTGAPNEPAMARYSSTVGAAPASVGPQLSSILLGLGVALLVVAATIFAAVTWNRLGAVGQGLLLIGLTVAAAGATRLAGQRRLTATAEALGVLTVVMGPLVAQAVRITVDLPAVDDRTWSNWAAWSWWPGALLVIGALALAFSRWVGVRSSSYIGAVLVQIAVPFWVLLAPVGPASVAVLLVLQATVLAAGPAFSETSSGRRTIWGLGAAMAWTAGAMAALVAAGDATAGSGAHLRSVGALAGTAASAGAIAHRWYRHVGVGEWATAGCALAAMATMARAIGGVVPDVAWWPLVGVTAVGVLMVAPLLDGAHRSAARTAGWFIALLAATPVLFAAAVAAEAMLSFDALWHTQSGAAVELTVDQGFVEPLWVSAVAGLLALTGAAVVDTGRWSRRALPVIMGSAAVALTVVVPPLLELPLGAVVGMALSVAAVLAALAWRSATPRVEFTAAGVALAIAGLWSVGPVSLELVALGAIGGFGALLLARGLRIDDGGLAGSGAVLAALAVVAESARAVEAVTADATWAVAIAAIVAALAGVAMAMAASVQAAVAARPRIDRRPPPPGAAPGPMRAAPMISATPAAWTAVIAGSTVLLLAHLLALVSVGPASGGGSLSPLTLALLVGAASAGAIAGALYTKSAAWMAWAVLAGAEVLVLSWLRLADAGVSTLEAYTLPLAMVFAVGGWLSCRDRSGGWRKAASWQLEGPALALALVPTVLLALGDPGVLRQVVGLAAGAALLTAGAALRRRAPVDVGIAAVILLGIQGLGPYAAEVPRWISFGLVGALLVALGATFEQRRQDMRQARRHYAGLR